MSVRQSVKVFFVYLTARRLHIKYLEVAGSLHSTSSAFVTIRCVVTGDDAVSIKWLLCGWDITERSLGSSYIKGETTSKIEVNYASVSDVLPHCKFKCDDMDKSSLVKCVAEVSCQALRVNTIGLRQNQPMNIYMEKSSVPQESNYLIIIVVVVSLAICLIIGFVGSFCWYASKKRKKLN